MISTGIPRKMMQTWKTREVPERWQASIPSIHREMPDWEHVLCTDEDNRRLVQTSFPDFLEIYDRFRYPIQRADAIRYLWLYLYGGIYLDLDFELKKPLDPLFSEPTRGKDVIYVLPSPNSIRFHRSLTNSFMASTPRNPFWLEMIEEMKKPPPPWVFEHHHYVLYTTGSLLLDRMVKKVQSGQLLSCVSLEIRILPTSVAPYSMCVSRYDNPDAYTEPLGGDSWVQGYWPTVQYCYCHATFSVLIGSLVLLAILGLLCLAFFRNFMERKN